MKSPHIALSRLRASARSVAPTTGGVDSADGNAGDDAKRDVLSATDRLIDQIKQSGDGAPFISAERTAAL
jgi:hypothetical protein